MEASTEAQNLDQCVRFFEDCSTPAPILDALHPGLAIVRAFLNAVISGFTGHLVARIGADGGLAASSVSAAAADWSSAGSGASTAEPPAPADPRPHVRAAVLRFARSIVAAGAVIRAEVASSTLLWSRDLYIGIFVDAAKDVAATA